VATNWRRTRSARMIQYLRSTQNSKAPQSTAQRAGDRACVRGVWACRRIKQSTACRKRRDPGTSVSTAPLPLLCPFVHRAFKGFFYRPQVLACPLRCWVVNASS
jgi:hypothetical protein